MKQPASKNKISSKKPTSRKWLILALLAVLPIVTAIVSINAYVNYQDNQKKVEQALAADKARFAKVETDMASAYTAMIAAAGKPETETISKSCSHVALKFEEGPLGCGITYDFKYLTLTYDEAVERFRSLNDKALESGYFSQNPEYARKVFHRGPNGYERESSLSLELIYEDGMQCRIYMSLDPYSNVQDPALKFDCYSLVTRELYPLAE